MKDRIIKKNKVAVAISPGFGAGWSTWNNISPFEPKVIKIIQKGERHKINKEWCKKELGDKYDNVYCGGAEDLEIEWLPIGTRFSINEYDGSESIYREDELEFKA